MVKKTFWYIGIILCLFVGGKLIYQQLYNPIININSSQIFKMSKQKENFTLLIGRDSCESCVAAKSTIISEQRKDYFNIIPNKIYYYDTDKYRNTSGFKRIIDTYNVKEVPIAVKFSHGREKIINSFETSNQIRNLFYLK